MDYFKDCNSNKEIMKRVFELSASKEISRGEINKLADKRRKELEAGKKNKTLTIKKVIIPSGKFETLPMEISSLRITKDYKVSNTILVKDGIIMF